MAGGRDRVALGTGEWEEDRPDWRLGLGAPPTQDFEILCCGLLVFCFFFYKEICIFHYLNKP